MRVLELFAGIGGLAAAWPEATLAAAIDISQPARNVYQLNFPHPYLQREIESLGTDELAELACDFWWLSPPCQPYTVRGKQHDLDDPRSQGLLRVLRAIDELRPHSIAIENVPSFSNSRGFAEMLRILEKHYYHIAYRELCPTEMSWPNRRARFYLIASQEPLIPWQTLPQFEICLPQFLSLPCTNPALLVTSEVNERFGSAMHRVDAADASAVTACFGSSYGKSILKAGSYLVEQGRVRRFSPREVLNLLGFSPDFRLPGARISVVEGDASHELQHDVDDARKLRRLWKLVGNSLALPVVRYVLEHLPRGPRSALPWLAESFVRLRYTASGKQCHILSSRRSQQG